MTLSIEARNYLDHFEIWDTEGPTMRGLWAKISPAECEEIREALREQRRTRNAAHADTTLRGLPKKWRDVVIARFKDLP